MKMMKLVRMMGRKRMRLVRINIDEWKVVCIAAGEVEVLSVQHELGAFRGDEALARRMGCGGDGGRQRPAVAGGW